MSAGTATSVRKALPGRTAGGGRSSFPALPQVNLLPPEIGAVRALNRTKRLLALVVVAVVALVVLGWLFASQVARSAEDDLAAANATTQALLEEQRTYAPVTQVIEQIQRTKDARALGMDAEIDVAGYVGAMAATVPPGVTIAQVSYTGASPTVAAPVVGSSLAEPGLGLLTLEGRAPTLVDAVAWQRAIDDIPGLRDAWVDTVQVTGTESESYLVVTATAVVDRSAALHRFDQTQEASE